MSSDRSRSIVRMILCFLFFAGLVMVVISLGFRFGAADRNTVEKAISGSSYADRAYDDLCSRLTDRVTGMDMDDSVADNVVSRKTFKKDFRRVAAAALDGRDVSADGTQAAQKLGKNLDSYFSAKKLTSSDRVQKVKAELMSETKKNYEDQISFDFGLYFHDYSRSMHTAENILLWVGIILGLASLLLLIFAAGVSPETLRDIALSLLAAAVACGIIAWAMVYTGLLGDVAGDAEYYRIFHQTFVRDSAIPVVVSAIACLVAFAGTLLAGQRLAVKGRS